jgi:hypothetical protein
MAKIAVEFYFDAPEEQVKEAEDMIWSIVVTMIGFCGDEKNFPAFRRWASEKMAADLPGVSRKFIDLQPHHIIQLLDSLNI